MSDVSADYVLQFWFDEKTKPFWFVRSEEFDLSVRTYLQEVYALAVQGQLDFWKEDVYGCLAYILLLDQVPRNIFRGTPRAFATDNQAVSAVDYALECGYDRRVDREKRQFFYLPYMHAEDVQLQERCVTLFEGLGNKDGLFYAQKHKEIIDRFHRFPHRNEILGRVSTPEEVLFLQTPYSSF